MTHTHTHTHFLRYFVWGDFFFRSIQLCMYTQHTQTPFLKSKVAHTHSHMNDLRYTKSDTRMLVKQQTVTMRLAVIVAMLTHGVCVCVLRIVLHSVTQNSSKQAYTVIINPPIPIVVPPPPSYTHTYIQTNTAEKSRSARHDFVSFAMRWNFSSW